ncbi:ABC transporter ATP-binding protein [Ktedonobacter robiniae]|uniref:Helicase n=1 Tax=Ktedonobacter robiniae TaxID=2778365 RepID=A0ABQ3UZ50_9CHLR|nr:ABC transporter ATP-binding protein [Ktedonobacter robiniae]GHO57939.1 helicase [Ktedonobacter robiniae]
MLLAVLLLGSIIADLVTPQILSFYIDTAQSRSALSSLLIIALFYLVGVLLTLFLTVGAAYIGEYVSWTATNMLRADLAVHCLSLDISFHNAHTPGEFIERIDGDVSYLANFLSNFVVQLLGSVLLLFGIVIALLLDDWRLGIVFGLFALVALLVMGRVRNIAIPYWQQARQASADYFGFLEEHLDGREDIRSQGATAYIMQNFYRLLRKRFHLERKASLSSSLIEATSVLLFTFGYALAFASSAYLYFSHAITIGAVFLVIQYIQLLETPIQQVTAQLDDLQKALASIKRIEELFRIQSQMRQDQKLSLPEKVLSVAFEHVSFAYNPATPTLHDISFQLEPGKTVGVLGRTGSGKSTIARLMLRMYSPTQGTIRLGGVDSSMVPVRDIRARVGLVTQDVQLFHATVRDNLTFFDRGITDQHILTVLDNLGRSAWYQTLPEGLDTLLDPASGLSAGEAQLLAFARVFLRNPDLVILDEASSRLDPETERLIEQAIDKLLYNRTCIIIAHRLSTIRRADTILILQDGQIVEQGNYSELSTNTETLLHDLLQTQEEQGVL